MKILKAIIFSILLIGAVGSCQKESISTLDSNLKFDLQYKTFVSKNADELTYISFGKMSSDSKTIETKISHGYIGGSNTASSRYLTHKGNCKFCQTLKTKN